MRFFVRVFVSWLPLAVAITGICLLVYTTVQQNYRQSLNDPQVQMAEDAAQYLAKDYTPAAVIPSGQQVDIATSLTPWVAVYDESGNVLESSGVLHGAPVKPPIGVFDVARGGTGKDTSAIGQDRVSWQPAPGVRSAIVVQHISGPHGGFVVTGRNMREVENRETQLSIFVLLTWVTILVATFIAQAFARVVT